MMKLSRQMQMFLQQQHEGRFPTASHSVDCHRHFHRPSTSSSKQHCCTTTMTSSRLPSSSSTRGLIESTLHATVTSLLQSDFHRIFSVCIRCVVRVDTVKPHSKYNGACRYSKTKKQIPWCVSIQSNNTVSVDTRQVQSKIVVHVRANTTGIRLAAWQQQLQESSRPAVMS